MVQISFQLSLSDGTSVDCTDQGEVMAFEPGDGQWLPALEALILSVKTGETQVFLISPDHAFGYPDSNQQHWIPLTNFESIELVVGNVVEFDLPNGDAVAATVLNVEKDRALLDFSHPLAGKELILEVQRVA